MTNPIANRALLFLLTLLLADTGLAQRAYLGFDKNDYPGDALLPALHKEFRYTSFWLNDPPGEATNSWAGKRRILMQNGFGFLVLFNGRLEAQLRGRDAAALGAVDGRAAAAAAQREDFAPGVLIFLDQEEGGRLLPEQAAYIFAWIDAVRVAGARPGVYCSGIETRDESGATSTALDIATRERARDERSAGRRLALWIANDACPPAPGCRYTPPLLAQGVIVPLRDFATVWQYALSPRRTEFTQQCPANTAPDGNCYAPGLPEDANTFVDLDTANSPDPSETP